MGDRKAERSHRVLTGIGLALLGLLLLLSLTPIRWVGAGDGLFPHGNLVGQLGRDVSDRLIGTFGFTAIAGPFLALVWAFRGFDWLDDSRAWRWSLLLVAILIALPPLIASLSTPVSEGHPALWATGAYGRGAAGLLAAAVSWVGASLILLGVLTSALVGTLGLKPLHVTAATATGLGRAVGAALSGGQAGLQRAIAAARDLFDRWRRPDSVREGLWGGIEADPTLPETGDGRSPTVATETDGETGRPERSTGRIDLPDPGDPEAADLPPLDLLQPVPQNGYSVSERELDALGDVLVRKLRTFRIETEIGGRTTGPVVTQFELIPASGVKVGKIASLADDLALALKAPSVRIIAPIPGKGAVGVEVPNPEPEIVYLREILTSTAYQRSRAELPLALGEDVTGRPHVADLARMPHLLIAGVTGSGKSVCINAIISSLIYRHSPERLRLLMVDPKMVELAGYNDLPHLRHPVVTDNEEAASMLRWLVYEMERRYDWLSANACRNLREYNRRVEGGMTIRAPASEGGGEVEEPDRVPYIVLIIDELADLMMTVQSEIEKPLAFLAQKARATGIHLVVATQRPSVNVITGLIKANFPCRIAFRVASKVDSRTIIDQNGAETLLGDGDMLFLPPGEAEPVRIQGTFVSTEDTERLMAWYRARAEERRPAGREEDILEEVREREAEEARTDVAQEVLEDRDPLFQQAAEIVVQHDQGSTSLLQRRLRIGYGRAARIVDQLHHAGVVGPPEGSKPREVLVTLEELDEIE